MAVFLIKVVLEFYLHLFLLIYIVHRIG